MKNVREIALKILYEVEQSGSYSDISYTRKVAKNNLSALDKAFLKELVNGTLKMQAHLDWVLDQFLTQNSQKLPAWIRNILRLGLYQILFLDKVPKSAATNESVELAKKYGHKGTVRLVNGVLRNIIRNLDNIQFPELEKSPIEHISAKYSHPRWLVKRWVERFGIEETIARCQANNQPAPNTIRTNTLKIMPKELKNFLEDEDFAVEETIHPDCFSISGGKSFHESIAFQAGLFYFQDVSFAFIPKLLGALPGERILELCAAPGGKTTHLAQLMNNQGAILAVDSNENRLGLLEENCARLGVTIAKPIAERGEKFSSEIIFDRILIDAPCSDIGVWRRRADARWRMTEKKIAGLTKLQYKILQNAASMLKTGGILVYSTCTTEPEENELLIEKFLAEHREFSLEDGKFLLRAKLIDENGFFCPVTHKHNLDGAFAARFRKNS